jgi:hypothetical protein
MFVDGISQANSKTFPVERKILTESMKWKDVAGGQ